MVMELFRNGGLADAMQGATELLALLHNINKNAELLARYSAPYQRGTVIVSDAAHITSRNPDARFALNVGSVARAVDIRAYTSNAVDMLVQLYDSHNTPMTTFFTLGPGDRVSIPIPAWSIDVGGLGGALQAWEAIFWV